jgi:hypothetical protein
MFSSNIVGNQMKQGKAPSASGSSSRVWPPSSRPRFGQPFLQIGLFRVFLHNYVPDSFISKNGLLARRRNHLRRACVCRRQYYWRAYVRWRGDLESTWQIPRRHRSWRRGRSRRSTTPTSAPRSMAPRYLPINRTLRPSGLCAHSYSSKLEISA